MEKIYVCVVATSYEGYSLPHLVTTDKAQAEKWLSTVDIMAVMQDAEIKEYVLGEVGQYV
jgi:hypothetical protein